MTFTTNRICSHKLIKKIVAIDLGVIKKPSTGIFCGCSLIG
jgi:hypothetical protein